jgi:hypothetical protein
MKTCNFATYFVIQEGKYLSFLENPSSNIAVLLCHVINTEEHYVFDSGNEVWQYVCLRIRMVTNKAGSDDHSDFGLRTTSYLTITRSLLSFVNGIVHYSTQCPSLPRNTIYVLTLPSKLHIRKINSIFLSNFPLLPKNPFMLWTSCTDD